MAFKSMGYEAEAQGWRMIVRNGAAELVSDGSGAYNGMEEPWSKNYTVEELRELRDLFADAVELLTLDMQTTRQSNRRWVIGQELNDSELEALPVGARIRDADEHSTSDDMRVWIRTRDGYRLQKWPEDAESTPVAEVARFAARFGGPTTLVSLA